MPELIDRQATIDSVCNACPYECAHKKLPTKFPPCYAIEQITEQPTIEPEVRHGRWIYGGYDEYPTCSYCKQFDTYAGDYCGNCGARMDATDTNVGGKGGAGNE